MMRSEYMGWSMRQWGEAVAWFSRVRGYTPMPDHQGSLVVRHYWKTRHGVDVDPSDKRLVLVPLQSYSQRRSERDVLMCDDPQFMPPFQQPSCLEVNMQWAYNLFVSGAGLCRG